MVVERILVVSLRLDYGRCLGVASVPQTCLLAGKPAANPIRLGKLTKRFSRARLSV